MDVMPHEDFDVLEERVREMVRRHKLPPEVTRFVVKFEDRWDGEPMTVMELFTSTNRMISPAEAKGWAGVKLSLTDEARSIVGDRIAHVRFLMDGAQG